MTTDLAFNIMTGCAASATILCGIALYAGHKAANGLLKFKAEAKDWKHKYLEMRSANLTANDTIRALKTAAEERRKKLSDAGRKGAALGNRSPKRKRIAPTPIPVDWTKPLIEVTTGLPAVLMEWDEGDNEKMPALVSFGEYNGGLWFHPNGEWGDFIIRNRKEAV